MSPFLLVTGARADMRVGGRQQLAWLHRDALAALFGERLIVHELVAAAVSRRAALAGYLDGLTPAIVDAIVTQVRERGIGQVWLDGSNLGLLAAAVKRAHPRTEVMTFCHNVEARFFWGSFAARPSPHAAGVLAANWRAERRAVRWSDRVIALSARDGALLKRLYGRNATDLLPMALADHALAPPARRPPAPYALFVGGGFYANLRGVQWYAREVAPQVGMPTVVVGRGTEALRHELAAAPGVRVVGGVDDLAPWYRDAAVAIAPIFDGSGMKTKVAEALMFGKRVVGTPEAFSGYADDIVAANRWCEDARAFAAAIRAVADDPSPTFDRAMRALYERDHSPAAARGRLAAILRLGPALPG